MKPTGGDVIRDAFPCDNIKGIQAPISLYTENVSVSDADGKGMPVVFYRRI